MIPAANMSSHTPTLRVVVDAHMVGHRQTGNETYVRGLLSALGHLPDLSVAAAIDPGVTVPESLKIPSVTYLRLPTATNLGRLIWGLNGLCRRFGANVMHSTYVSPLHSPCPTVVTAHDISFRRFPHWFSTRDRLLFATLVPASLRRAAAIITDSDHALSELRSCFPRLSARARSIPLGVGPEFRPAADQHAREMTRERYGLGSEPILTVGGLHPRKNLDTLIHAFARVHAGHRHARLAIVGPARWEASSLPALARSLGLSTHVRFLGYVPQRDLPALYDASRLFVYPSVYEGFGLPVLEAMACATPVVAIACSSIPEVAGDAACLAPAPTVDALARAMDAVLRDDGLARTLVSRGTSRAKRFSWSETARLTRDIYRSVVGEHASPQRRAHSIS